MQINNYQYVKNDIALTLKFDLSQRYTDPLQYDGIKYALHQKGNDIFESDSIAVNEQCRVISLIIGNVIRTYNINVITGAKEDDLFSDF